MEPLASLWNTHLPLPLHGPNGIVGFHPLPNAEGITCGWYVCVLTNGKTVLTVRLLQFVALVPGFSLQRVDKKNTQFQHKALLRVKSGQTDPFLGPSGLFYYCE